MDKSTDRIEKKVVLRATPARVWRALTDAKEFGTWFGVALEGAFEPGAKVGGRVTNRGYEHVRFEVWVERLDQERHFSFRWHPAAIDPEVDYTAEPTTLVTFELAPHADGTQLTIVESGFDALPMSRRADAFRMNDGGWTGQAQNIARHVEG